MMWQQSPVGSGRICIPVSQVQEQQAECVVPFLSREKLQERNEKRDKDKFITEVKCVSAAGGVDPSRSPPAPRECVQVVSLVKVKDL